MKSITLAPDSELVRSIREASSSGEPLLVDAGDGTYRLRVESREQAGRSGAQAAVTLRPSAAEAARSIEGIRRAAGGWKDIDAEALKAYLRQRRRTSDRPPVRL